MLVDRFSAHDKHLIPFQLFTILISPEELSMDNVILWKAITQGYIAPDDASIRQIVFKRLLKVDLYS